VTLTLTERDLDLLETLTCRVSLLTLRQAMQVWWPNACSPHRSRRRLKMLAKSGWIKRYIINIHPPLPVLRPLFRWRPGIDAPNPDRISAETQTRWSQPARPTEVLVASPQAACLLGSTARRLPPAERRDHELRLASVYLHYRTTLPRLAGLWVGKHALPRAGHGNKGFSALLRDDNGRPLRVIHAAGRWNLDQVESFHEHCADTVLPYELW
jgi:hypothetical protein